MLFLVVLGMRVGNFSVYVFDERGQPHHNPHAHIKISGQQVGSIFLHTMVVYNNRDPLPAKVLKEIRAAQEALLNLWAELNEND